MSRFSQAISEGDGISVIPALGGADVAALAAVAEAAGAEAIAVGTAAEAEAARAVVGLPVLVRQTVRDGAVVEGLRAAGADAFVLVYEELAGEDSLLEELHEDGLALDLDCALDVRDEEELERTLDLLPDVPAGKLVVAESGILSREQVLALERAGVDGLVVRNLAEAPDFSRTVGELAGS